MFHEVGTGAEQLVPQRKCTVLLLDGIRRKRVEKNTCNPDPHIPHFFIALRCSWSPKLDSLSHFQVTGSMPPHFILFLLTSESLRLP